MSLGCDQGAGCLTSQAVPRSPGSDHRESFSSADCTRWCHRPAKLKRQTKECLADQNWRRLTLTLRFLKMLSTGRIWR
eukprot:2607424-Rhodomonas_salina.1